MDNVEDYNNLMLSMDFWKRILEGTEHVLIFQSDTILCRNGIDEFLNYDFIGARIEGERVMNGGLSLRKTQFCINTLSQHVPGEYENEDIFFSRHVRNFPSDNVMDSFSIEKCHTNTIPLGLHKTYVHNERIAQNIFLTCKKNISYYT